MTYNIVTGGVAMTCCLIFECVIYFVLGLTYLLSNNMIYNLGIVFAIPWFGANRCLENANQKQCPKIIDNIMTLFLRSF